MVVLNGHGQIVAMVGGRWTGGTNRATSMPIQPSSAIKPFDYLAFFATASLLKAGFSTHRLQEESGGQGTMTADSGV
jgi:membrane carboxypeptidase/penicillin-binding protein